MSVRDVVGVLVDGDDLLDVYRALERDAARGGRDINGNDGRPVRRELRERFWTSAIAAQALHVRSTGPVSASGADIAASFITTGQLAERLHCTTRHALRLAAEAGIERVSRGKFRAVDAQRLIDERKART